MAFNATMCNLNGAKRDADVAEGKMTRIRASVVDETTLAFVATQHGLVSSIRLGVGEDRNGGRERSSIRSDVVEAILGAVYVDGGSQNASEVVIRLLGDTIAQRLTAPDVIDPRSSLQEQLASEGRAVVFTYERTGPDHGVVYTATALVDERIVGTGTGASKKSAAIDAARRALESLA